MYAIKAGGYAVAREIDYEYAKKKQKDESGETVEVDDTSKVKSFEGALIPKEIMETVFFAEELAELTALMEQSAALEAELDEMREEESGEEGLLKEVLNEKGDSIPKANPVSYTHLLCITEFCRSLTRNMNHPCFCIISDFRWTSRTLNIKQCSI